METLEYLSSDVKVFQDDQLYRFTSDAIKLSEFACVKKGDVVADFCSGSGIVGFNLYALNGGKIKSVTLFEMQKPLYELSVKSIEYNGLGCFSAVNTRLQDIGKEYAGAFSLIVCNPPYMDKLSGEHDKNPTLAICRREIELSLQDLVTAISRALKYGGRTCIVHRADRLADVICALRGAGIEPKRIQFVSAKGKAPYLFMIEGVKGGKSGMKVLENALN